MNTTRRNFLQGIAATVAATGALGAEPPASDILDLWQRETDLATPQLYSAYRRDGKTRGVASLEKLERGFDKVLAEIKTAKVEDHPLVWLVYNMGFIVKTKESLFSIDLNHRRDLELVPLLDFALITHNHGDHFSEAFYRAMNGKGKTVITNFKDNYGAADWRKGGHYWDQGGFTRAEKTFKFKDVEIRTSLTDHNQYLVDFTTTFEIKVGNWKLFHTGDCGNAKKLKTIWGNPDLWLVFPGCGIHIDEAYQRIQPKKMAFGHLWELGHATGRLTTPMVKRARAKVQKLGGEVVVPLWGERVW